LLKRLVW
jgi:hypothetical protein